MLVRLVLRHQCGRQPVKCGLMRLHRLAGDVADCEPGGLNDDGFGDACAVLFRLAVYDVGEMCAQRGLNFRRVFMRPGDDPPGGKGDGVMGTGETGPFGDDKIVVIASGGVGSCCYELGLDEKWVQMAVIVPIKEELDGKIRGHGGQGGEFKLGGG